MCTYLFPTVRFINLSSSDDITGGANCPGLSSGQPGTLTSIPTGSFPGTHPYCLPLLSSLTSSFSPLALKLLSLTQSHTVVAVVGGVCSGKSKVIKVAADTFRGQGAGLTLSWIFPGALDEGELFGREVER